MNKEQNMKKITWKDDFKVNVKQIDDQHHCFVSMINLIIENIDTEQVLLEGLCEELIAFARFHFLSEQNLMLRNNYPNYDGHKKEHNLLLRRLNENIVGVHFDKKNVSELLEFLFEWFANHSNNEDKTLGKYLNSKKKD